jgi:hypothetical protein
METIKDDVETLSNQDLKSKGWILINPPTLFEWCEISKSVKFLLSLQNNKGSVSKVVPKLR